MLSQATTPVAAPSNVVMWKAAQVAERDGVTKQAVTKKVRALAEEHGLTVVRDERGAIVEFNIVEYDRLRGRTDDPSKDQRQPAVADRAPRDSDSYDEALRQRTWVEAESKRLDLAEKKGELVRVEAVEEAAAAFGETLVALIDQLPNAADDLALAVANEGTHGLRLKLKALANQLRADIAAAMNQIAATTPAFEEERPPGVMAS